MRLSKALEEKKLDLRLRDKLLHEGRLTKSDVDSYLTSLPNDESNATVSKIPVQSLPRHADFMFSRALGLGNSQAKSTEPQSE